MTELYWRESKNTLLNNPSLAKLDFQLEITVMINGKSPRRTDENTSGYVTLKTPVGYNRQASLPETTSRVLYIPKRKKN